MTLERLNRPCRICGDVLVRHDRYADHGSVIENYRCRGQCLSGGYAIIESDGSRRFGGPVFNGADLAARYSMQGTFDVAADGGRVARWSDEQFRPDEDREEWPDVFRTAVELFESSEYWPPSIERPGYRNGRHPNTFHYGTSAPLRPDAERVYTWKVLFNPHSTERHAWIMDGSSLKHTQTAAGAGPDDMVANDRDLTLIQAGFVHVFVALTKVGEWHTRGGQWLHDDAVTEQAESVVEDADPADVTDVARWEEAI